MTKTQLDNALRTRYISVIKESLEQLDEEILVTASNELTIPCLDDEQNERFVTIKITIPKGSKDELYDGYAVAESYELHRKEVAEKKAKAKALADAKKKRDAEMRAKAKAKRENANK